MPSIPRVFFMLMAATVFFSTLGCSSEDKHVFFSTPHRPTTLSLVDSSLNQSLWEMDIPVNHKLVMDFESDDENTDGMGQAESWVTWELYRVDGRSTDTGEEREGTLADTDRIDLTGTLVRMQVSFRPSPELPGSLDAAPAPVTETAQSVAMEAAAEAKAHSQRLSQEAAEEHDGQAEHEQSHDAAHDAAK